MQTENATGPTTLLEGFSASVRRHPHRRAVICNGQALTYAELDHTTNALAARIQAVTSDPDRPVAVYLERSVGLVTAAVATLKTGSSYVPLDPSAPPARLALIVADVKPELIVTSRALTNTSPAGVPTISVDDLPGAAGPLHERNITPSTRAYVIFTSGTTGRPKGVEVSHENVVRLFTATDSLFRFGHEDVWSMFHSFAFDVSVWEMWGALLYGGCTVIVASDVAKDPVAFRRLLREEGVTVLTQTPTAFMSLSAVEQDVLDRLPVTRVIFAGEALRLSDLRPWVAKYGDDVPELVNMYGITETTVHSSYRRVMRADLDQGRSLIGGPLPDLDMVLVDENLAEVAPGEAGEIVVTGPGVSLGYFGQPEMTRQRFVSLPGRNGHDVRGYRSGDLARRLPDGDLEYLGRLDDQVKIRGFRVELGEIQTALAEHPLVRHAAAGVRETSLGERELVAYVVPVGDVAPDDRELRAHLSERLPNYMVPVAFKALEKLPLTANGKLDRSALAEHWIVGNTVTRAPRSLREELLCELFAHELGRSAVGIDDDFFILGGHSLAAVRLVNRIRVVLGLEVTLRGLFEARTVAVLAERVDSGTVRPALSPCERPEEIPLSYAQQRLWFLHQFHGASQAYHISYGLHLTGTVNAAALEAAICDVVVRHEILRTSYRERDGTPLQWIRDPANVRFGLTVIDTKPEELDELTLRAARRGFDLANDLPLRAELLVLDEHHSVLVLVLHHIAGDGWSLEPLTHDLAKAYSARLAGQAPDWSPLPVQYSDYAIWQRELLGDPADPDSVAGHQLAFWTEALRDMPDELDLPTDRRRPSVASFVGDVVPLDLDVDLHARLVVLARDGGATVNMVLQAALAALLTRLGAGTDLPIGNVIAGRTDDAVHDLVGFFVNTLVTRTDTSGDPSFAELLRRVRTGNLAMFDHAELPFERLVEMINPVRSPARHPLAQVMLGAQITVPADFAMPGLMVDARPIGNGTAKFDLSFKLDERRRPDGTPNGIAGVIEYSSDLFNRATIERIGKHLVRLLRAVSERPDLPLRRIDILGDDERHKLLVGWNDTGAPSPTEPNVAALIERQVDLTPDSIAVVQLDRRWTYRELDERANQYAHLLRDLGAGPESRIGLCLTRGLETVAAILGVWKAGAAFAPLDPEYPADRRAFMVGDSGASILLTEGGLSDDTTLPDTVQVVRVDRDDRLRGAPRTRLELTATQQHLAYVVYTSGSTGRPKGVLIEHRGVLCRLDDVVARFGLTPDDINLQIMSIAFEAPVREIFGPLAVGATVAMLPPEGPRDPEAILTAIRGHRPTSVLCVVPSILESAIGHSTDSHDFESLRVVGAGGEMLRADVAGEVARSWGCEVVNQYGPTETTMMALIHQVRPADLGGRIPVGRPLSNTNVFILDSGLSPAPIGVTGEVYLAGAGVGRGYCERPGLTSTRFVANPFGVPGERMYRTGDLGRWLPDGNLDLLGRVDDQVKVRGLRVELGEVEAVLSEHTKVGRAAVIVREDRPDDRRLVAYVVPADIGARPGPTELRDHLSGRLPDQMIPAAFVVMDELPVRGNGKLNVQLLPTPDFSGLIAARPPRSPREEVLCELFAEVLGLPTVGIDDDFFQLGGHSLLAARLISQIRARLGVELPMHSLFEAPTVAGVAQRAGVDTGAGTFEVVLPLRVGGTREALFCVHPGGGLSWSYSGFLKYIRTSVGVYGVQARGLLHPDDMPTTVEEMAQDYVRAVRLVQPHGPYHLLGWSFGGIVAYEMAVQLQAQGAEVGVLTMLDCYPGLPDHFRIDDRSMIAALLDPSRPHVIPQEGSLEMAKVVEIVRRDTGALSSLSESQLVALLTTMSHNRQIVKDYIPKPFSGDVLFFLATQDRNDDAPTPQVWQRHISGEVVWHAIECTHATMNHPSPLAQIGRILDEVLTSAMAASATAR